MKVIWHNKNLKSNDIILAGDVGGTNTNLAYICKVKNEYKIIFECIFSSRKIINFEDAVIKTTETATNDLKLSKCCISAAGVVINNKCNPTNLPWTIDCNEIEKKLNIPSIIINDFLALSYGIPLLDTQDPNQITKLSDNNTNDDINFSWGIVGAGTGLGVGHLVKNNNKITALPSEGGHSDIPVFDEKSEQIVKYLWNKNNKRPGSELLISGQGIVNIFYALLDINKPTKDKIINEILNLDDKEKPPAISKNASTNNFCKDVMKMFVKFFGKFSGNMALTFLSKDGMYLAGGIASKNESFFKENNLFMNYFTQNYNIKLENILKSYPVYIIKEYSTSLLGAAHGGDLLL